MNKYEIRTERKKKAIINVALELFGKKGFVDVSIKEIASLANVSQVSIYNYFGSKEGLVKECAYIVMEDTLKKAKDLLVEEIDFKEKLCKALSLCSSEINKSLNQYFSVVALEDSTFVNLLVKDISEIKRSVYIEYIELGKKEGEIDKFISTTTILDFINSINEIPFNTKDDEIETKQKDIGKLFLYGIIGK